MECLLALEPLELTKRRLCVRCTYSYSIEWGMIQVSRLMAPNTTSGDNQDSVEWDKQHRVTLYAVSKQVFVYQNQSHLKWWPPSGPSMPRLALIKLNTNLTSKQDATKNGTTHPSSSKSEPSFFLSADCSIANLSRKASFTQNDTTDINDNTNDHWIYYAATNHATRLSLNQCCLNDPYYECDNTNKSQTSDLLPMGTGLLYEFRNKSTNLTYLLGLYVGTHSRTRKLVFVSLNTPFLNWTLAKMEHDKPLFSVQFATIFWTCFIIFFNIIPVILLAVPQYK